MALTYFKRYRMEFDLFRQSFPPLYLPTEYQMLPWRDSYVELHAQTKYQCFQFEVDANVFPCLGELDGCRRLMNEITRKEGFLPQATWLLVRRPARPAQPEYCGTIQGIELDGFGAVQNLGVTRAHRGRQLGTYLLSMALEGFREAGLGRACLEVTAQNTGAMRLYRRLGFHTVKTVYKAAEVAYA